MDVIPNGAAAPVESVTRRRRGALLALALVLGTCAAILFAGSAAGTTSTGRAAQTAASVAFAPIACSEVSVHLGGRLIAASSIRALRTARCGYLVVPENRSRPTGRTIRLAVALVPPDAGARPRRLLGRRAGRGRDRRRTGLD
jgi:hypothetical protein